MSNTTTLRMHVIDRDGFVLGSVPCKVGLQTYAGKVTRHTDKTVWTMGKDGIEQMHRAYDGRLPSVYKSHAPAAEVQWKQAGA